MKYYLLIAGYCYYPELGTGDWIGCFDTHQEAEKQVKEKQFFETITKGKDKGKQRETHKKYIVKSTEYDWYQIVDLMEWTR